MSRQVLACAVLLLLSACSPPRSAEKAAPPAKVAGPVNEVDFTSLTLTPEAEARLAIETVAVEERELARTRVVGGEVVAPPGRAVTVAAPLAGTILMPASGEVPPSGSRVRRGQTVLRLRPLPAAGDLAAAQERLETARTRAHRAEQLLEVGATSAKAVEDARGELAAAESAARALAPASDTGEATGGGVLALANPEDGVMGALHVAAGQSVAAATPLFDIVPRGALWVRVPIYVGDFAVVDPSQGAVVRSLGDAPGTRGRQAQAVPGPPTADPVAVTSDLFFSLPNADGAFRPGERVSVELHLRQAEKVRVVPWSAVVYDVNGGTWVYETSAPHVYVRRRVQIRSVDGDLAVLSAGPATGNRIVWQGAAELFGTELGNGK